MTNKLYSSQSIIPRWAIIVIPVLLVLNVYLWTIPVSSAQEETSVQREIAFAGPIHDVPFVEKTTVERVDQEPVVDEPIVIEAEPWEYMISSIESYLGSRPLSAYSSLIAKSCYETGMDPYWFCTIAITESGGGANCFKSSNAWGYGSYSWSSWEESIPSFCSMFVRGYGSGLTATSHLQYCPGGAYYQYV